MPTCDRCETGERQRIFSTVGEHSVLPCRNLYAVPDAVLLHISEGLRRRGITVSRNSLARCNAWHLRIRRLVQFIFAGAVYHNALSNCAALLCRTLRRVARMCSSTLSDPANRLRKTRKKKSSAVPLFRSGRRSPIFARLTNKGKVGVQRGRETAGVPSFLPTAAGRGTFPPSADGESLAEVQRKTLRPLGRTR